MRPSTPHRLARGGPFAVVQAPFAALALARLARGRTRAAPLRAEGRPPPEGGVSVIVPARHEADRIGPCLAGLAGDPDVTEILVVVDPDETDGTANVARAAGARVVDTPPLPPGWVGKPWALEHGLRAASGRWVVWLDADVRPEPGLARALVGALAGADLVTGATRFVCETPGERFLHPAMLATLVYRFGPPGAGAPPSPARVVANGQCMAARRDALREAGGFALAPDRMTDDVGHARALASRGWRVAFVDASELVTVRMQTSLGEVWREWGRSLSLQDVTSPGWLALDLGVVWLAQALPLARVLTGRATALDRLLVAVRVALVPATASAYVRRGAPYWLSPLADLAAAANLTLAAARPRREWRGRTYGPRGSAAR
jgi:dolichol-phosphate mannosyltransferase